MDQVPKRLIRVSILGCLLGGITLLLMPFKDYVLAARGQPLPISHDAQETIASVTMSDNVQVDGSTLTLNGIGLRSLSVIKVYVVGLYLDQKSKDPVEIIHANERKLIAIQFVRNVSKAQLAESFQQAFDDNSRDALPAVNPDVDSFMKALVDVKAGDRMSFYFAPGKGPVLAINGVDKLTMSSPAMSPVLLSVWLGPKPPTASLKQALLWLPTQISAQ